MRYVHEYAENKIVVSECLNESLLMAASLRLSNNQFHIAGPATEKAAKTMARHDEKTSAGRAKMLSGGDTDRLAEVNEVLECLVVQIQ